ncbi:hypothetical protein LZC95_46480 [Pendulispora brunnea]|uniref:Uncharacterized protein n=1 Tax=Pendulispora brunnea TaxID=2905690 RepID=A0ABZ2K9V1_9BACT
MLFRIDDGQWAEDDGSAWHYGPDNTPTQKGPLSVTLLRDGPRVVLVGGDILVGEEVALELEKVLPESKQARRVAHVRGPQPAMEPRPPMLQLLGLDEVRLSQESIRYDQQGRPSFKRPYILDPSYKVREPNICKIRNNGVTVVSDEIKDLLLQFEPKLWFEAVCYEGEEAPDLPKPPPFRIPTMDELLGGSKR